MFDELEVDKPLLLQGDCAELLSRIPDASVDAIITDPPYSITQLEWDKPIDLMMMWGKYKRIIKKNGAIVVFCQEPFTSKLICSNEKYFKEKLTWEKHKPSNIGCAKYRHLKYNEEITIFSYGKHTFNPQMQR